MLGAEDPVIAKHGFVSQAMVFVKVPREMLKAERQDISFRIEAKRPDGRSLATDRTSIFIGPRVNP